MQTQSEMLAGILLRPVADDALLRARLHLIDWIGCAAAGAREANAAPFRALAGMQAAGRCFTMHGQPRDEAAAAFANGALGNLLEMDDTDRVGLVHPGDVIVPAVLACAQASGLNGRAVLTAMVRGYEAMIRLARAVGPGHYAYWHNTATCGPFGAAAGVSSLLGLGAVSTAHALGHAGSMSAGFWQLRHEATATKQMHTAHAAHAGLMAARIAELGGAGPLAILEGPQGFFAATCPDGDVAAVSAEPDAAWRIFETTFKPWPSCRHAHCAIEAALALRDKVTVDRIESITLETFNDSIVFCDRPHPTTPQQARFSLQHVIAVTLSKGAPELADLEVPALRDKDNAALRERIRLVRSADCDRRYPAHMSSVLRLTLKDGTTLSHESIDALGDPEKPLDGAGVVEKAVMLMDHAGMTRQRSEAALALLADDDLDFDLNALAGCLGAQ